MAKVARGKALVAKLRAQAGVRDPEALAAYLGRFKQARKAGRSAAEAAKIAGGTPTSKGGTRAAPLLPKTGKEAAEAHVQGLIDSGDERIAKDKALQDHVRKNWERIYGDSIENASPEYRRFVEKAHEFNDRNPRLAKVRERFGAPAVVVKKEQTLEENPHNMDIAGAGGQQIGPTTIVYDHKYSEQEMANPVKLGHISIGSSSVAESMDGLLRHEYGHYIEHAGENKGHALDVRKFRSLLPDAQQMKGDLSYYAGINYKSGNHSEPFAEIVALVTAPTYNRNQVPESMKPAAKYVEGLLGL